MCLPLGVAAQSHSGNIPRLTREIRLDGLPDEAAWSGIAPLPLTMYEPYFKGEMTEKTEIRIAYDNNHIYASAIMNYRETGDVRVNTLYRDRYRDDDIFAVVIDPFNDNKNTLWFFINPEGVRFDYAVSNDAEVRIPNTINRDWNTYWDAKTVRSKDGWTAEIEIPFSSIGLEVVNGHAEIGVITYRYIVKKAERHIFPAIPPNWTLGFAKASQAYDLEMENVQGETPVYLTPYLLAGNARTNEPTDAGMQHREAQNATTEAGFDLKLNLDNNFTLDASYNTDFAQVEADNQQVNLTRFPLLFPEKRQFFLERASIFSFNLAGADQLFFSRRIGLDESGSPIPVIAGLRFTGRWKKWDMGVLDVATENPNRTPPTNNTVVRLSHTIFNRDSYLGVMGTSQLAGRSFQNLSYGFDGLLRVFGNEFLTVKYARTAKNDTDPPSGSSVFGGGAMILDWTRRTNRGFNYALGYTRYGGRFKPGLGFITRTDYSNYRSRLSYSDFFQNHSSLRRWESTLSGSMFLRNRDHSAESSLLQSSSELQFISGATVAYDFTWNYENLTSPVSFLPGTNVAAGNYRFISGEIGYEMASYHHFRVNLNFRGGGFYDGSLYSFQLDPVWTVSKHLEFEANYQLDLLTFLKRDQSYTSHLVRVKGKIAFSRDLFLDSFLQYKNSTALVVANMRIRYNFGEGRDLWVVFNDESDWDRPDSDPSLPPRPVSLNRTILLKLSYALNL